MHLWGKRPLKVYGGRMSESILAILCHIIKGEAVIKVCTLMNKTGTYLATYLSQTSLVCGVSVSRDWSFTFFSELTIFREIFNGKV